MRASALAALATALVATLTAGCGGPESSPTDPVAAAFASPSPPVAPVVFAAPTYVPGPKLPRQIVVADFDRDGLADLAVTSERGDAVTILRSDGAGGFRSATLDGAGPAIEVADLDADGALDIVAARRRDTSLALFRGLGDGSFADPVAHPTIGGGASAVALADLDSDGDLDIATANASNDVSVLRGDGRGGFAYPTRTNGVADDGGLTSLAAIDLGGDGSADLAVSSYQGLSLIRNDGRGNFGGIEALTRAETYRGVVRAADVNSDGLADLVASRDHTISVLLGDGRGGLGGAVERFFPPLDVQDFAVADLNGDGRPDLAVSEGGRNSVSLLLATADGFEQQPRIKLPGTINGVAVGDLDGDCVPDVAAGRYGGGEVATLRNLRDEACDDAPVARDAPKIRPGAFPSAPDAPRETLRNGATFGDPIISRSGRQIHVPVIGDFDSDGVPDLAIPRPQSHEVLVLLGSGEGRFALARRVPVPARKPSFVPCQEAQSTRGMSAAAGLSLPANSCAAYTDRPIRLGVADLDGDSHQDLIVATDAGDSIAVLRGDGRGDFAPQRRYATGERTHPGSVALGDLNGDGAPDVISGNTYSRDLSVLVNDGRGGLGPAQRLGAEGETALADLDNDGDLDLIALGPSFRRADRPLTAFLNDGEANFVRAAKLSAGGRLRERADRFAVDDIDSDGVVDIVIAFPNRREIAVLRGAGGARFDPPVLLGTGGDGPEAVAAGDVTGDRRTDIVVASQGSNEVVVLAADGSGGFDEPVRFPTGSQGPFALFLMDVNGDRMVDLITVHSAGKISVRLAARPKLRLVRPSG